MKSEVALTAPALALVGVAAWAQTAEELPAGWPDLAGLAPLGEVPVLEAPAIQPEAAAARAAAASRAGAGGGGPFVFAEPFAVEATPSSHGLWQTTADGATAVWRLRVRSEGAVSLNLGFSRYRMPPGGLLRLRTADGGETVGPFTEADNESHGELWTPILPGGDLVIEAAVPVARAGEFELEIGSVNRGFRELTDVVSASGQSCPVDVACSAADDHRDQVRSVGMFTARGVSSCTGTLLNNTSGDGTPYFLTARHCGFAGSDRGAVARSLVVYWNYESPTCGARSGGSLSHVQWGAKHVAGSADTDYALLELDDPPDSAHNLFFAGWDRSEASVASAVAIHHAAGDVKAISITNALSFGTYGGNYVWWLWNGCQTGAGASGSPLFDQNGRVVSQLRGSVWRSSDPVWRWRGGRLDRSWTRGLRDRLDPADAGVKSIDGKDASHGPSVLEDLDDLALKFVEGETPASRSVDVAHGFRDPDGDTLTYVASSSAETVVTVSVTGSTVTVTAVAKGTATVTVTATDKDGADESASQEFEVTVGDNSSPEAVGTIAGFTRRVRDGARSVDVASSFSDADSDTLTYGASSSASSVASVSVSGSTVTVTPVAPGVATVTATATDGAGSNTTAQQRFEVVVNRSPVAIWFLRSLSLRFEDGAETVDVSDWFEDPDGDALTYGASSSYTRVATVSVSGSTVTVTPLVGGETDVTVTATDVDGSNLSATRRFRVYVANRAPMAVGTLPESVLRVGEGPATVGVSAAFLDPEGDWLTYAATSADPDVAGVRRASRSSLRLTPVSLGSTTVTVTATDVGSSNKSAEQQFTVRVLPARGVGIDPAALTVDEGDSDTYTVVLAAEPSGSVTVTPSVPSGTDVSVSPSSLTFTSSDWDVAQTVTVEAAEDADAVSDPRLTVRHSVSGGDYGSVSAPSVEVTILENDTSALSTVDGSVAETGGEIDFVVSISVAGTSGVLVDYETLGETAQPGSDYTATSGTLTFAEGSTSSQTIRVPVLDDDDDEDEEETFGLTLSNVRNGLLAGGGSTLRVTGTIRDDDDPRVTVLFSRARYEAVEGGSVTVQARLDRDPERTVAVPLESSPGADVLPEEHSELPFELTFGPGVRTSEFLFSATSDGEEEDVEEIVLTFGTPLQDRVTTGAGTVLAIRDAGGGSPPGGGAPPPPPDDDDSPPGGGAPSPPPDDDDDGSPPVGGGGFAPPRAAIVTGAECSNGLCRALTGVAVRFEDASRGRVQRRQWDFGDGTSLRAVVNRPWSSPGFYEVTLRVSGGGRESTASLTFLVESSAPAGTCVADPGTLCLQDSRFAVSVDWRTASGESGSGRVVHAGTNDSGLFSFFGGGNWEVLIKVLDGCSLNGHAWVYGASTTDLGYAIRVTDTATGAVMEYVNEPGSPAPAIVDVEAFQECAR